MHKPHFSVSTVNQTQIPAFVHNLPASIAPNTSVMSNLMRVSGYTKISVGLTLSQPGTVSIQRYLDDTGTVAIGAPTTQALTAGAPSVLTLSDENIFGSFQVSIANASGATAQISNLAVAVAVATVPTTAPGAGSGSYQIATQNAVSVQPSAGGTLLFTPNPVARYRAITLPRIATETVWLSLSNFATVGEGFKDMQPGDTYEMTVAQGNLNQGSISAIATSTEQPMLIVEGV